jgi:hypothetical protein
VTDRSDGALLTYYEVLGVARDATRSQIAAAYRAKLDRVENAAFDGAPPEVVHAVDHARATYRTAYLVLASRLRAEYDREIQTATLSAMQRVRRRLTRRTHAQHVWTMEQELGLPLSPVFGMASDPSLVEVALRDLDAVDLEHEPLDPRESLSSAIGTPTVRWGVSPLTDPISGFETLANWLGPHPKQSKSVVVPDVCGLPASEAMFVVTNANLRVHFVQLTKDPTGRGGTVVSQDPQPGMTVARKTAITVNVVYPDGGGSVDAG